MLKQRGLMIFKCSIFFCHSKEINTNMMFLNHLHWGPLKTLGTKSLGHKQYSVLSQIFSGSLIPLIAIRFPALSRRPVCQETQRKQESYSSPAESQIHIKPLK